MTQPHEHDNAHWARRRTELQEQYRKFLLAHGVDLEGNDLQSAVNSILVTSMAGSKTMTEAAMQLRPQSSIQSRKLEQAAQERRHHFLRHLWERNLLDSPWRILIDQEFPGDPPAMEDFERYVGEMAEKILQDQAHQEKLEQLRATLQVFLDEHGYKVNWRDGVTIATLVSLLVMNETRQGGMLDEERQATRSSAKKAIADARSPNHPAWRELLQRYFPAS